MTAILIPVVLYIIWFFVVPAILKWLWNMTMPDIFNLKKIRYWQAFRLVIIFAILTGGHLFTIKFL